MQVVVEWWVVPDTIVCLWIYVSTVHIVADECLLTCYEELYFPGVVRFFCKTPQKCNVSEVNYCVNSL